MANSVLMRKCVLSRPSRRNITSSSPRRTSTSPQRYNVAAPVIAYKRFEDIPGPIKLPLMKHHEHILPRIGCYHHTVGLGLLESLRDKYGDLVRLSKTSRKRPVLYVFDPELMKQIYESQATEVPEWVQSPLQAQRNASGKCPMQRDEAKAVWTALQVILQDDSLIKCFDKVFNEIAEDLTRRLGQLRHAENALNEEFSTEIYRWSLETIGVVLFGERLGCLAGPAHVPINDNRRPEKTSMDDDIKELCSLSQRCPSSLSPAERLVRCTLRVTDENYLVRSEGTLRQDSAMFKNALEAVDDHYRLMEYFLENAQRNLEGGEIRSEQILIHKLRPLGDKMLPFVADAFLAGAEPLAQSAVSMCYHLSLHAALQQRAHDELCWSRACREEGAAGGELPYITACVREAMRLKPATGGVVRRATERLLLDGYEVPAGVDIVLAHGVSSKNESEWGRANSFIPERWCHDSASPLRATRAHSFASLPYGLDCPVSGMAGRMLAKLAANMLDKYRLEWHGPQPKLVTSGVNKLQPPYYFVLQNAS
ncbi:probable cytochrome P450 49a1 isoform X1 [Leptidea sinapis]|uniref:probable cytochrome P450 49a1 isoform X1 n=1 Tax=Leptidea sinapis TaxID=189913 RepID=UPI002137DF99|nr:probable cytochrome P450 49a1 isoform X1 [Leptidea sinapis]